MRWVIFFMIVAATTDSYTAGFWLTLLALIFADK